MVQKCSCKEPTYITDFDRGETCCKKCGVIIESDITEVNDIVINTYANKLAAGTNLGSNKVSNVSSRIQYSQTSTVFIGMFRAITSLCNHMRIPKVIQDTAVSYGKRAIDEKMTRGRRVDNVAAACIMIACRDHGRIITEQDMFHNTAISRKSTRRIYRDMKMKWEINQRDMKNEIKGLINRICTENDISYKTKNKAIKTLDNDYDKYVGSHPSVCAAGLIISMCSDNISQKKICKTVGVTEVSVRSFARKHKYKQEQT